MSKTIVQEYGPIYGEAVNGTVMGRPNGSVYVPLSNRITLTTETLYLSKVTASWGAKYYALCASDGTGGLTNSYHFAAVAEAQDLADFISVELFSDSALTTKVGSWSWAAGNFNVDRDSLSALDYDTPQVGDTLYMVAYLNGGGQHIAATTAIALDLVA